ERAKGATPRPPSQSSPSDFVCKMQKIASDFIKIDAFRIGKNERKHVTICNRMSYVLPEITRQTEKARN
ncbi:MAG: hypothetical protein IIT63_03025, partial [Prevotella sp.]|nr:hypothetical protein [Prevotella sp.]